VLDDVWDLVVSDFGLDLVQFYKPVVNLHWRPVLQIRRFRLLDKKQKVRQGTAAHPFHYVREELLQKRAVEVRSACMFPLELRTTLALDRFGRITARGPVAWQVLACG
jgi:hypothetical protein